MKKICKKLLIIFTALALTVSAFAFGACDYYGDELANTPATDATVSSQGGWAVQKGDYIYFINGMTTAPTDEEGNTLAYENKYGDVVRGSLLRIKASDMAAGKYDGAETVVPLLMVASDYTSGIFIYGDYVYYATPTTTKNLDGETESDYVDFKRSRLDGTRTMGDYYFRSQNPSAEYRFVAVDNVVYCLHMDGSNLYSFNTETGDDTLLAKNTTSHVFNKADLSDPYVYYTMGVTEDIDKTNAVPENYTQVYRVKADATYELDKKTASYKAKGKDYEKEYKFDKNSLEKIAKDTDGDFNANDITTYPYVNLGQLLFDGIGRNCEPTQYNWAENAKTSSATPSDGYTYTLIGYENGGLYYKRQHVSGNSGTGEGGNVYYIAASAFGNEWNSVTGNASAANVVVSTVSGNATASSLFYIKDNKHYYLYISGADIVRVEVAADGTKASEVTVAKAADASEFLFLDNTASDTYKYVYYTVATSTGVGVGRAVYDSTATDYAGNEDEIYNAIIGEDEYKPVNILAINHPAEWYKPEIINDHVFFVDTTVVGSAALNNAQVVSLTSKTSGKVMDNKEIKEYNELLVEVEEARYEASSFSDKTGNALYHYYYTGDKELIKTVIAEYKENNKQEHDEGLFSKAEQDYYKAYVENKKYAEGTKNEVDFTTLLYLKDDDGNVITDANGNKTYYGLRSYFYNTIGILSEEEQEDLVEVWKAAYLSSPMETEEEGLEAWQWALIGVAIGVGVIGIACGITIPLVIRNKKKNGGNAPKRKKYVVDMTDDESIDVYATEESEAQTAETVEEPVDDDDDLETVELPMAEPFGEEDSADSASDEKTEE